MNEETKRFGKRKQETLNHFSCNFCNKWWTVGDAPNDKEFWFCPWCGVENQYIFLNTQ